MIKEQPNEEQQSDMAVIWDWENTAMGIREREYTEKDYDLSAGFYGVKQWWDSIGKVIRVFMLSPMHKIYGFDEVFQNQKFSIVLCPKITKVISAGVVEYEDTTDASIITLGEFCVGYIPSIRYLCLGSGDKHFIPLLEYAKSRGIKIAILHGNESSLSSAMWDIADKHPKTGKKMVHLFSPIRERALNSA